VANLLGTLRFRYVRHMDHRVFEAVTVEGFAARTSHQRAGLLRWKLLAGLPHSVLPSVPIAGIAPFLKIGLSPLWQERCPCALEISAGLVERRGRRAPVFAGMTARIEPAIPFPWIGTERIADAPCDRAGVDVAVIDVPAVGTFGVSAAGEGGHGALKRELGG
jgi:hypothetical protein